jgi:hypothetical protein
LITFDYVDQYRDHHVIRDMAGKAQAERPKARARGLPDALCLLLAGDTDTAACFWCFGTCFLCPVPGAPGRLGCWVLCLCLVV